MNSFILGLVIRTMPPPHSSHLSDDWELSYCSLTVAQAYESERRVSQPLLTSLQSTVVGFREVAHFGGTKIKLSVSLEEGTAITDRKQSLYSVEQWLFIVPRTGY